MRYDTRYRTSGSFFNSSFPSGVKSLLIANVVIYLIYYFGSIAAATPIFTSFVLKPFDVLHRFMIWQLATYMFLHSLGTIWHLLFNMLALWMFGTPVEQTWGTRRFLHYYFLCGIGGGICVVLASLLFGGQNVSTLGASAAIYGLLLAFGMLFPNQEVLFAFLFPIKAKYMVIIYGAVAFLLTFRPESAVSNIAHLGGMIFGYFYIRQQFTRRRPALAGAPSRFDLGRRWREYKLQRARKKFQVYMKKHGSGPLQ